jgi:leucyl-tRNA synthetase
LHLLYARFFHKLMRNEGLVSSDEPFTRLLTQGMVIKDGSKMSKSKGNTVDPLPLIESYGADTVRMFTLFASPPDQSMEWQDSGVVGCHKFLKRLWKIVAAHRPRKLIDFADLDLTSAQKQIRLKTHQTRLKASDDFGRRHMFNTAIAATMELLNTLTRDSDASDSDNDKLIKQEALETIILVLAPIVPHFCHVLWQHLGHEGAVIDASWPLVDESALIQSTVLIVLQVNGKLRARIDVQKDLDHDAMEQIALNHEAIKKYTDNGTVRKVIVVPGRLVNIVVN